MQSGLVASLLLVSATAFAQPVPIPTGAPTAVVPTRPTLTWFSVEIGAQPVVHFQLSTRVDIQRTFEHDTLVLSFPGVDLDSRTAWTTVDLRQYNLAVDTIEAQRVSGVGAVVRLKYKPGAAPAPTPIAAAASDGYHYARLPVGLAPVAPVVDPAPPVAPPPRSSPPPVVAVAPTPVDPAPTNAIMVSAPAPSWTGPRFNISGSVGYNSPSGILGLEFDMRIARYFSVGAGGGYGLWGPRVSALGKLEIPLGRRQGRNEGLFFEGAFSLNMGGTLTSESGDSGMVTEVDLKLVPTASISMGGRVQKLGPLWTGFRLGYTYAFRSDAYEYKSGPSIDSVTQKAIDFAQPGGFVVSFMGGISF